MNKMLNSRENPTQTTIFGKMTGQKFAFINAVVFIAVILLAALATEIAYSTNPWKLMTYFAIVFWFCLGSFVIMIFFTIFTRAMRRKPKYYFICLIQLAPWLSFFFFFSA